KKLGHRFFGRGAEEVARRLIGKTMVHRVAGKELAARIVETEAYLGPKDLASHSSKGRTKRTAVMFGPAGRAYVYFIYGMHEMFNIVGGSVGDPQAVLVRGGEGLDEWDEKLTGPARLVAALGDTRKDYGMELSVKDLYISDVA